MRWGSRRGTHAPWWIEPSPRPKASLLGSRRLRVSEPALRITVVILCGAAGLAGVTLRRGGDLWGILGALVGLVFGLLLVLVEQRLRRIPGRSILQALVGLLLGLLVGRLLSAAL